MKRKTLKPAHTEWSLDSGGFSELSLYGRWVTTADQYIAQVRRYRDEIGGLQWAAPQDAMCEPWMLEKSKAWLGGTVEAHQRWTVDNWATLKDKAADLNFVPVLQGWEKDDYLRHVEMYDDAGIDLTTFPVVGLGSVCRRQATNEIAEIVEMLHGLDLRLHGFGVKTNGLKKYGHLLASADSFAWSFGGRRQYPCPVSANVHCANCLHYAVDWRDKVLAGFGRKDF